MLLIKEFLYICINRCIYLLHLIKVKPGVAFRDMHGCPLVLLCTLKIIVYMLQLFPVTRGQC